MAESLKNALLVSSLLNLLFLVLASIFVIKKGSMRYLINKINRCKTDNFKKNMYDNPFYRDKQSHFENLPQITKQIIFLGDSLTDLCEWSEIFRNEQIKNRGICGDTTDGILNRISNIVESKPKKLFIMIGINDLNQGVSAEDVVNNYKTMLETFKNQIPNLQIFVQSLLPVNNQLFINREANEKIVVLNSRLKEITALLSFQYIDLFADFLDKNNQLDQQYTSDGIHLNGQGYLVWKAIIEKYVVN